MTDTQDITTEPTLLSATGRLGKHPESRETKSGEPFTRFSIASTGTVIQDNEIRQETRWLEIQAFEAFADYCLKNLKKGDKVMVKGKYRKRAYETKEGESRIAEELTLGGSDSSLKILNGAVSSSDDASKEETQESSELSEGGDDA